MGADRYTVGEGDLQDAVELTRALVAIPTESPGGEEYGRFIDRLEHELTSRLPELELRRIVVPPEAYGGDPELRAVMKGERIVLLGRIRAPGKPMLHLNDHYDVVPAGDPARWTVCPPFEPRVVNGRIFGRGACDSKGSIASLIQALTIIRRDGREPAFDLTFSFTPDEELGAYSGLVYLIERTKAGEPILHADAFFAIDGHQNHVAIGKVGLLRFRVAIEGKRGHIARSFTAVNAIHLAVPVLNTLMDLGAKVEQRVSALPGNPDLPLGAVRANFVITSIEGGSPVEVVPDACVIVGARTVLPDEAERPMEAARNELVSALLSVRQRYQIPLRFHVEAAVPPFVTSDTLPPVRRLREVASRKAGALFPAACSEGFNEIALVTELGIPVFARGVQTPDCNVHTYDENVPIRNLQIAIEDLVAFLSQLARTRRSSETQEGRNRVTAR